MIRIIIVCCVLAFAISCAGDSDVTRYKQLFESRKSELDDIRSPIRAVMAKELRIFKYRVSYVNSSQMDQSSYRSESTPCDCPDAVLDVQSRDWILSTMNRMNLSEVWVYRDSTKYFFRGANADVIVEYNKTPEHPDGKKISENVFLSRSQSD